MTPAKTAEAAKPPARQPRRHILRAIGKGLRLVPRLAGVLFRAALAYRGFEREFVRAAALEGMPEDLARGIARQLRPREMARGFNWKKMKKNKRRGR